MKPLLNVSKRDFGMILCDLLVLKLEKSTRLLKNKHTK